MPEEIRRSEMKKGIHKWMGLTFGLALLAGGLAQSPAQALGAGQVPFYLNYQGRLQDKDGNPIEGTYTMTFTLYADEVGAARVWAEMQDVTVVKGMFHVLLGTLTPLDLAFDRPYWLGVKVGTDPEMRPLTRVVSVPYAFRAQEAYTLSGGIAASREPEANKLLALNANGQFPASVIPNNAVGTARLADQAVTAAKLADGAVDTAKLADNAVTSAKIADETIGTDDIVPQAVTTSRIANGAVQSDQLADGAVTVGKIAPGAVTIENLGGPIGSEWIKDGAVTDDKISSVSSEKVKVLPGYKVFQNHTVSAPDNQWLDVPEATLNFSVKVPSVVWIAVGGSCRIDDSIPYPLTLSYRVLVDGTEVESSVWARALVSSTRAADGFSTSFLAMVGAGTHTLQVQVRCQGAGTKTITTVYGVLSFMAFGR